MGTPRAALAFLAGLLAFSLACAVAGAGSGGPVIPAGNLLANPNAEQGQAATNNSERFDPPGWQTGAGTSATEIRYGTPPGFPTVADSAAINGGSAFFAGGPQGSGTAPQTIFQTINVATAAAAIDAGQVRASVGGCLGGYLDQEDRADLTEIFLDQNGGVIGTRFVRGPSAADRGSVTGFLPRSNTSVAPTGTRQITVGLQMTRTAGSYNDGYADNLTLTLLGPGQSAVGPACAGPPVLGKSVNVGIVSGTIRVREKGTGKFHILGGKESIPVGSSVDATKGKVSLASAKKRRGTQTMVFFDGRFKVRQNRRTALTDLSLEGGNFGSCPSRARAAGSPRVLRRLWGHGKGNTRTSAHNGSGTVRGTFWLTEDRCDGTFWKVREGVVVVRDFTRHRTVVLHAGQHYLAPAR